MDDKEYRIIAESNIRLLVKKMNEMKIQKENVVSLLFNEQYILVYLWEPEQK